jgi:hypothetical protein
MPKDSHSPRSALVYQRCFEPARHQQQLRSEAYKQLVPTGSRVQTAAAGRGRLAGPGTAASVSNPCGGICA